MRYRTLNVASGPTSVMSGTELSPLVTDGLIKLLEGMDNLPVEYETHPALNRDGVYIAARTVGPRMVKFQVHFAVSAQGVHDTLSTLKNQGGLVSVTVRYYDDSTLIKTEVISGYLTEVGALEGRLNPGLVQGTILCPNPVKTVNGAPGGV